MYRILVADDEGIMLEAFKSVISSTFGDSCITETAKTGRAVTEKAETFHPDIVFMDIHMPGINGIQAMREIRKFNTTALFYVVSAYDKFDYAKEAIDLGVERYLTKPISKAKIISAVEEAIEKVDKKRNQRSNLLKIQEKLETVIPVVENSFVGSLLFQQEEQTADYYRQLLDIEEKQGYVMVIQFGQSYENGRLISPVGMNVKAQSFYDELRDVVKSSFSCAVGSVMSNRIPVIVPCSLPENPYEERIDLVEQARNLVSRLENRIDARFRIGLGRIRPMRELERSYREALRALNGSKSRVIHIEDLSQNGVYDEEFPVDMEKRIFRYLGDGDEKKCVQELNTFFDWMLEHDGNVRANIEVKVLELIIRLEMMAFEEGSVRYGFRYRENYLEEIQGAADMAALRCWFVRKTREVCDNISTSRERESENVVFRVKSYINDNYAQDISLDDVSRLVDISPYYFSKLFKQEVGENFIEYLTRTRITHAMRLLEDSRYSIKEVCLMCGYSDPNYFSRIFKKYEGMTPSEYRER